MSWQAMTAVSRHSKQDGVSFRLLLHLAEGADAQGNIDPAPNQDTLAAHFECTNRTIRNRINAICAAGELAQVRIGSGPGNPSAYKILLPGLAIVVVGQDAQEAGNIADGAEAGEQDAEKAEKIAESAEAKAETNPAFLSAFEQRDGGKAETNPVSFSAFEQRDGGKAETNPAFLSAFQPEKAEETGKAEKMTDNAEGAGGKAEKAETNPLTFSAFQREMAELKAEISSLKAEILSLKAETKGGKGGKNKGERRKAHSFKNADDPSFDPIFDPMDPKRLIEPKREEDPPLPPRTRQLADLVNALSEVTVMDGHANWGVLSQTAEMLMGAYTANQILLYYGRGQPENGHWNWYLHDWRGLRNEPPAPSQILATIKRAAQGMIPQPPTAKEQPAGKMAAADSYAEVFGT